MRYGPVDMPDVEALEDGVDDLVGAGNRSENEESENEEVAAAAAEHQDQDEGGYGSDELFSDDLFGGYYEDED